MYTITKEFTFEAAHFLYGHPKCGRLHGHSYRVIVELQADELQPGPAVGMHTGMVRDYAELNMIKQYIDEVLDHRLIVGNETLSTSQAILQVMPQQWLSIMNVYRTTAEEISRYLFNMFADDYPELTAVTVCETAKTSATYRFERGLR